MTLVTRDHRAAVTAPARVEPDRAAGGRGGRVLTPARGPASTRIGVRGTTELATPPPDSEDRPARLRSGRRAA